MLSPPSGSRRTSGRELGSSLLATVVLMLLPKIDVAFPNRRRKGVPMDSLTKVDQRLVVWGDRKIVLFDNKLFLPTVSIEFPRPGAEVLDMAMGPEAEPLPNAEEALTLPSLDEPLEAQPEAVEEHLSLTDLSSLTSTVEAEEILEGEETLGPTLTLGTLDNVAPPEEDAAVMTGEPPLVFDGPVEQITGGALVLVEGEKGPRARELMQQISLGVLENGRSVTYVTTSQSVQDLIMEMFNRDQRIASYLPDHRLLCVPVYPLIEGKGPREGLLDKLMGSEQLRTSDALVIDSLSDFLGDRFEEARCMRLLEFVQDLNAMGKVVFLVVSDGQKGILPLRLESELQLSLPAGEGGTQLKRYQKPHQGATEFLRFQLHPTAGLLVRPLSNHPVA